MALVRPALIAMARNSAPIGVASRSARPNPSGRRHGRSGEGREMPRRRTACAAACRYRDVCHSGPAVTGKQRNGYDEELECADSTQQGEKDH